MNDDIKKYLAENGRKGGIRKVKKGFAMLSREQIAEACRRSAEARRNAKWGHNDREKNASS